MRFRQRTFLIAMLLCSLVICARATWRACLIERRETLRYLQANITIRYSQWTPDGRLTATNFPEEDHLENRSWFSETFFDLLPDYVQMGLVIPLVHLMIPLPKGHDKPYRENPGPYLKLLHRLGSIRFLVLSGSLLTN